MSNDTEKIFHFVENLQSEDVNERQQALVSLEGILKTSDADIDAKTLGGLRAVDVLVRGKDSEEAAQALVILAQAGAEMVEPPSVQEACPMHVAAYLGSPRMVEAFLDMGMPPNHLSSGIKQRLFNASACHAVALGFKASRAEEFAQCLQALLSYGADLNLKDRMRLSPIDIAMKAAAATHDRTLADAMLHYGVDIDRQSGTGAHALASAMSKKAGNEDLATLSLKSHMKNLIRVKGAEGRTSETAENDEREEGDASERPRSRPRP